jgi:hypothetical protein
MVRSTLVAAPCSVIVLVSMGVAACGSSSGGSRGGADAADDGPTADAAMDAPGAQDSPGAQDASNDAGTGSDASSDAPSDAAHDASFDAPLDAPITCLDGSLFSTFFTISDPAFCAVAVYTAPEGLGFQAPSWGSHGGPLVLQSGASAGDVALERWTAPSGAMGTMTMQTTQVAAQIPAGAYLGSQAIDLPFFGWTAFPWSGPSPSIAGDFDLIASGSLATSYPVNGPYSAAGVPAASSLGRFLFSGLSPLGMPATSTNGLYAADACSSPTEGLGVGTGCSASALVAAWGEDSGPVATDANGDVFAVLASASAGTQEARGFLASSVARGAAPTAGTTLFTIDGFGSSLAALVPTANDPGVVVFQPFDSTTFDALDVIEQQFTAAGSIAAMGTPSTLLTVPTGQAQGLSFMTDDSQRLWVAGTTASSTTYVVLVRQH